MYKTNGFELDALSGCPERGPWLPGSSTKSGPDQGEGRAGFGPLKCSRSLLLRNWKCQGDSLLRILPVVGRKSPLE